MATDRYLLDDEEVLLVVRRHWMDLLGPALATIGVFAIAATAGFLAGPDTAGDIVDVVFGSMAAIALARFSWHVGSWWAARVLVTNRRVVTVAGVLGRRIDAVPLGDAAALSYRRSVMGRLWGYGDFVAGAGGARAEYRRLAEPDRFYRALHSAVSGGAPSLQAPLDAEDTGPIPRVV